MRRATRSIVGAMGLWLVAAAAWAHPGHGSTDPHQTTHVLEPLHLLVWLAPLAIVALVVRTVVRRSR